MCESSLLRLNFVASCRRFTLMGENVANDHTQCLPINCVCANGRSYTKQNCPPTSGAAYRRGISWADANQESILKYIREGDNQTLCFDFEKTCPTARLASFPGPRPASGPGNEATARLHFNPTAHNAFTQGLRVDLSRTHHNSLEPFDQHHHGMTIMDDNITKNLIGTQVHKQLESARHYTFQLYNNVYLSFTMYCIPTSTTMLMLWQSY